MEMQSHIFLAISLFILAFILSKKITKTIHKYKNTITIRSKLPPGPWKLPLLGNLHQLGGTDSYPPWRTLRDLARQHGPIFHLRIGQHPTVVVSSARLAKEVIKTHDLKFAERPGPSAADVLFYNNSNIGFAPYGDYWRQMRRVCMSEFLGNEKVSCFGSIREKEVSELIESVRLSSATGSPINITKKLFSLSNTITCKAVFGRNFQGQDELIGLMTGLVCLLGALNVADAFPSLKFLNIITGRNNRLRKIHKKVDRVLDTMINEYKIKNSESEEEQNLLASLIRVQKNRGMDFQITDDSIKALIFEMFAAGTETTSTLTDWAFSEMVKNPTTLVKAQAEIRQVVGQNKTIHEVTDIQKMDYLKMVVKEALRLHPPAPLLIPRLCRETCEIDGYTIPINTKVVLNAWAIGRDPSSWDDPETFKPERFENSSVDFKGNNFEFIPFGGGRRICPGMSFALSITEIVLAKLLYHFAWKLPGEVSSEELNMDECFGFVGRRRHDLCVIPIFPYRPSQ